VGLIRIRETIVSKPLKIGQSEAAPIKAPPWMNSAWTEHFFHWVLVPPPLPAPNLPIVEGSKSVPRVLKLGFIQLDGIKMDIFVVFLTRRWVSSSQQSWMNPKF
jgi:hypothetical protein